jgi:hypothetical protein
MAAHLSNMPAVLQQRLLLMQESHNNDETGSDLMHVPTKIELPHIMLLVTRRM